MHNWLVYFVLLFMPGLVQAAELRIAVASNFHHSIEAIKQLFEQHYPEHHITLIKGSTGKLYAQIVHGAPYDVFLAADAARPMKLEQEGRIIPHSRMAYAYGKLALWSPQTAEVMAMLQQNSFQKMAIANPRTAPYGEAAWQTLQQLKLIDAVKHKLVYGENIAQTYQFVESGSADLGFVALSQIINTTRQYWLVPQTYYSPLEQQLVILNTTKQAELAKSFVNFMQQDAMKTLIKNQGYDVP